MLTETDMVRRHEEQWATLEPLFIADRSSFWHGALEPAAEIDMKTVLSLLVPLYVHAESKHYRSAAMLEHIEAAVGFHVRTQLDSGCVSLMSCNIDSPPDTAFKVHMLALVHRLLLRSGFPETEAAAAGLYAFLDKTRDCLATGGIHTPNHRWIVCGALALLYELFEDERLKVRAYAYLDEGFDMTEYGEWTERSNAIYNPVCDLFLYHVGRVFGHKPSYDAVLNNLRMMQYMLHPGNAVVTEYSGRHDFGKVAYMNSSYVIVLRLMASLDDDRTLRKLALIASDTVEFPHAELLYTLLYPKEMALRPDGEPLSEHYRILFNEGYAVPVPREANRAARGSVGTHPHGAPVVRHRSGKLSVTVMAGQRNFLYVQYGRARMTSLRLALGWFGIGSVSFPTIRRVADNVYRLDVALEGSYGGPLDKKLAEPCNGSLIDMPNHLRAKTHVTVLPVAVTVAIADWSITVDVDIQAVPHLFAQAVCSFDRSGDVLVDGNQAEAGDAAVIPLAAGEALYTLAGDYIRVGAGAREHQYSQLRNDHMAADGHNVIMNYMTPLQRRITIQFGGEGESAGDGDGNG